MNQLDYTSDIYRSTCTCTLLSVPWSHYDGDNYVVVIYEYL